MQHLTPASLTRYARRSLLLAIWLIAVISAGCDRWKKEEAPPPPTVEVIQVVPKDVPIYKEWVGALDGSVNAIIRPQVTGYLIKQNYREGEFVRKGQLLFLIDPRTFKATYDQTAGVLSQARGDLERQKAAHATAKANLARVRPLAKLNALSQKDLDDAVGRELASRASVDAARAAVVAASANVEKARLDLGFTRITSPIDGIAGIAKAQLGNLVGPTSVSELTSVSQVDPIKIYVNVSEQEYLRAKESHRNVEEIPLELILADGTVYPHKGRFTLADRQIDPTTGTLKVGALFPNEESLLRPGGYGKIRALMSVKTGAILIPQRAIMEQQGKYMVAVVRPDKKAEIRPVKVAERIDSEWVVSEGLNPGELVVVEGTQKVQAGMPVNPKPYVPAPTVATPQSQVRAPVTAAPSAATAQQPASTPPQPASPPAAPAPPPVVPQTAPPAAPGKS